MDKLHIPSAKNCELPEPVRTVGPMQGQYATCAAGCGHEYILVGPVVLNQETGERGLEWRNRRDFEREVDEMQQRYPRRECSHSPRSSLIDQVAGREIRVLKESFGERMDRDD
jgi:hypothetical protein